MPKKGLNCGMGVDVTGREPGGNIFITAGTITDRAREEGVDAYLSRGLSQEGKQHKTIRAAVS